MDNYEGEWINMNFKVPADLKRQVKTLCASRGVSMKDFFIHAIELTIEKYEMKTHQTNTQTHEVHAEL